jgi:hypothetical protein
MFMIVTSPMGRLFAVGLRQQKVQVGTMFSLKITERLVLAGGSVHYDVEVDGITATLIHHADGRYSLINGPGTDITRTVDGLLLAAIIDAARDAS